MDTSTGNERFLPPAGVRESAQVLHDGIRHRPNWPFLYYEERSEGQVKTYVNRAPAQTKYQQADVGEALI